MNYLCITSFSDSRHHHQLRGKFKGTTTSFAIQKLSDAASSTKEARQALGCWTRFFWEPVEVEMDGNRTIVLINKSSIQKRFGMSLSKILALSLSKEGANQKLNQLGISSLSASFDALDERAQNIILTSLNLLTIPKKQGKGIVIYKPVGFPSPHARTVAIDWDHNVVYIHLNKEKQGDERLGSGAEGVVKKGYAITSDNIEEVAISAIATPAKHIENVEKILRIVQQIKNEPVIDIRGFTKHLGNDRHGGKQQKIYVYMRLYPKTLEALLREPEITPQDRINIARDLIRAVVVLHAKKVLHDDIKRNNVMIQYQGNRPRARLADFNYSSPLGHQDPYSFFFADLSSLSEVLREIFPLSQRNPSLSLLFRKMNDPTKRPTAQQVLEEFERLYPET